jgi:hypothetical protein
VAPRTVSTATIGLVFAFTLYDGGIERAVIEQSVGLQITY